MEPSIPRNEPVKIFLIFLGLGLTSFGGPIAHISYFRREFVEKRHWVSDRTFADILSLCQFLPGPASSQVGLLLGYLRSGFWGACAAWLGFTLPSAALMISFGFGIEWFQSPVFLGIQRGLSLLVVAVVAQAILTMGLQFSSTFPRLLLSVLAGLGMLFVPGYPAQIFFLVSCGIIGSSLRREGNANRSIEISRFPSLRHACGMLIIFAGLLLLSAIVSSFDSKQTQLLSSLYRAGATVFGGGHAVLPLLEDMVVANGIMPMQEFLAGYGAAQALPGPLFSFSAFLGARVTGSVLGAFLALLALFLPAVLLVFGVLPFWERIRGIGRIQGFFDAMNSAVVGLLFATWIRLIFEAATWSWIEGITCLLAFVALSKGKVSPLVLLVIFASLGAFFEHP